jgi:aminoglycoside phosphotransferase (APT) family kinase protein
MARTQLTLAALATSAVPGLDVAYARKHSAGVHGLFDSALVIDKAGRALIIRVPTSQSAETEQSADLVALRALTTGNRSRLPFDVPEYVGQTPIQGTRAVVYELLAGDGFDADALTGHEGVSGSIGRAIAAIHSLPSAFIGSAGLPQQSAEQCRKDAIELIDRAALTGFLPAALLRRWEQATDDEALWQFAPAVVHGSMSADSFLVTDDAVSAILGWSGLCVGDPARDLHWLLAARGDFAESAITDYSNARQGSDNHITQRAMLYAELELARWLLHGVSSHDQTIIDDAVAMLDGLVDTVHSHSQQPLSPETGPIMTVGDVENMLDHMPRAALDYDQHAAMHTDSYNFSGLTVDSDEADSDEDDSVEDSFSARDAGADDGSEVADASRTGVIAPDHASRRSVSE